jgi:choline-sulfatase
LVYGEMLAEGTVAPLLMVRQGRYKYVYCETDPEQLFDLAADPRERHNLAGQTAHEPVRAALHEALCARWEPTQLRRAVVASQRRRRAVDAALRQGRFAPWDFQPHQDASSKYMRNHLDLNALEKRARYPTPDTPEEDGGS